MVKLVVSIIVAAAMVLIGTAAVACEESHFEFKPAKECCISKTVAAMIADSTLKIEILAYADKWDLHSIEAATAAMLDIRQKYLDAGFAKDRTILAWANKAPDFDKRYQMEKDGMYIRLIK